MLGPVHVAIGDEVEMRKPHACGENRWVIIRTGADIRIQCVRCGRTVLLPRPRFVRSVRKFLKRASPPHDVA
jgi:hypothetical protein